MTTEPNPPPPSGGPTPSRLALADLDRLVEEAVGCPRKAREYIDLILSLGRRTEDQILDQFRADPVPIVQDWYIARICRKGDHLDREVTRRHAARLRDGLLAGGDSPVERLIVDRAVTCYLAVQDAERNLSAYFAKDIPPRIADQKRLDHAQKRLLDCLKALDQVRRKTPAAHRLNVAVVLAGPPEPPAPPFAIDLTPNPPAIESQH